MTVAGGVPAWPRPSHRRLRFPGRLGDLATSLDSSSELDTSKMAKSLFRFSTWSAGRLAGANLPGNIFLPDLMEEGLMRGGGLEEQGVEV